MSNSRPGPRGRASAALLASTALWLAGAAGCATPTAAVPPSAAAAREGDSRRGEILSLRPAGGGEAAATILNAVGVAPAGNPTGRDGLFEFIIRQDDGQTVSVVQANQLNLVPGQRVALTPGAPTRIVPAAPGT